MKKTQNVIRRLLFLCTPFTLSAATIQAQTAIQGIDATTFATRSLASVRVDNTTVAGKSGSISLMQVDPITIPVGSDLRVALEKGSRLKRVGQPITAALIVPLYAGETLAAPRGTRVEGHVARITVGAGKERLSRLFRGDLTTPKIGEITIDALILSDGTRIPVATSCSKGLSGMHEIRFTPKGQGPSFKQKAQYALKPLHEPHKLQRFSEAAFTALPLHPNYLDQGTVYDAVLIRNLTLLEPIYAQATKGVATVPERSLLRLKLISDLNSSEAVLAAPVYAEVTEPFYDGNHALLYPVGSRLIGQVTTVAASRWLHKNGRLTFEFSSITAPGKPTQTLHATLIELAVAGGQEIVVSREGDLQAHTSALAQGLALATFVSPALAQSDPNRFNKTAFDRGGLGFEGFGVIGAGAAQPSASSALGWGYFGAAKSVYGAFLAKGSNVVIPANTPMTLRVD